MCDSGADPVCANGRTNEIEFELFVFGMQGIPYKAGADSHIQRILHIVGGHNRHCLVRNGSVQMLEDEVGLIRMVANEGANSDQLAFNKQTNNVRPTSFLLIPLTHLVDP